jgi:AraC-like DNA-binding protein
MTDRILLLESLLNAASGGVLFALTHAFDMRGEFNWGIKPRRIDEDMIVFSRGDNGYYDIGSNRYPLKKGRFLYISHDMPHSSGQSGIEFANVIAIRYKPVDRITGADATDRSPVGGFVWDCEDIKLYESLFMNVYHRRLLKELADYMLTHFCIASIYAQLLSDITAMARSADYDILDFTQRVRIYVDNCIRDSTAINTGRLAAQFGMSRTAFYRRFDKIFRVTFREYVYSRRMAHAAYLLTTTNLKVKQIAAKLRYSDQYIFANMFKQFYGVSPGSYAKYYPE